MTFLSLVWKIFFLFWKQNKTDFYGEQILLWKYWKSLTATFCDKSSKFRGALFIYFFNVNIEYSSLFFLMFSLFKEYSYATTLEPISANWCHHNFDYNFAHTAVIKSVCLWATQTHVNVYIALFQHTIITNYLICSYYNLNLGERRLRLQKYKLILYNAYCIADNFLELH